MGGSKQEIAYVINSQAVYKFVWAAVTKYRSRGGFNNRNLFFSQFWSLEVHDQGAGSNFLMRALFPAL